MAPKSVVETCALFDEAKQSMKEANLLTAMRDMALFEELT